MPRRPRLALLVVDGYNVVHGTPRYAALIDEHARRTGSPQGVRLLYQFEDIAGDFVKVIPREYAHMMELTAKLEASGLTHDEAVERAFELRG